MKIEVNRSYRTRDGRKVVITELDTCDDYPMQGRLGADADWWCVNGRYLKSGVMDGKDLVAEWVDDDRVPDLILQGSVIPKPQGLSLLEAMQSGKEFRIPDPNAPHKNFPWFNYFDGFVADDEGYAIQVDAGMLTARYELKPDPVPPRSVQVTAADIDLAFGWVGVAFYNDVCKEAVARIIKKRLGLGDDK